MNNPLENQFLTYPKIINFIMEGTQREIGSSKIPFIQCNERQLPRDHL